MTGHEVRVVDDSTVRPEAGASHGIESDALGARIVKTEQACARLARWWVEREVAPEGVLRWLVDDGRAIRAVVHREAHGKALHVIGLGRGLGMGLARLGTRLGPRDVLGARKREQLPQLRGIGKPRGANNHAAAVRFGPQLHGTHRITADIGRHGPVLPQDGELTAGDIRGERVLEHREEHPRFRTESGDPAVSGIEARLAAGGTGEGSLLPVERTHRRPE